MIIHLSVIFTKNAEHLKMTHIQIIPILQYIVIIHLLAANKLCIKQHFCVIKK